MKLAIISHTEHYSLPDGTVVGWGPTITEINHLLEVFDTIYHVAMHHEGEAPPSALPYVSDKIVFVPIPVLGGKGLGNKLRSLYKAAQVIHIVSQTLKKADCFQLRAPTGIGVFLIPYLSIFVKKRGWFKYAGNWNQKKPPLGYALQRWMLRLQHRPVTINGHWVDQPKHHLSFENPCLTADDVFLGLELRKQKKIRTPLSFCFVGRLEHEKGVLRIIEAFNALTINEALHVETVHFVGEGQAMDYYKSVCVDGTVDFKFHGALSRADVFDVYKKSHAFLLPTTASEGFPKVIAEAMNFGCVPIVSDISSIGHYIKAGVHGFLMDPVTTANLQTQLKKFMDLSDIEYKQFLTKVDDTVGLFTFSHYNDRIESEILKYKTH